MQSASLITTIPSSRWYDAPVGQTRTHEGCSQWWHCSGSNDASSLGQTPRCSSLMRSREWPSGTWFSARHATTHALQLMHFFPSTTRANRLDMGPSPDLRDLHEGFMHGCI